jgi:hypothetical protein
MKAKKNLLRAAAALLGLLLAASVPAEDNYLHQSVRATMLVADPAAAADRLEAWCNARGGYVLYKSDERVSFRLPHAALPELRPFLEELSEDVLDFAPQAVDLREQLARTRSSLASRREMLERNLAMLGQADVAGTLAIEQEMLGMVKEVEDLEAALARLGVDQAYALAEVALRFEQAALPEDIPSSFPWINEVGFYRFVKGGPARGRSPAAVRAPAGYATLARCGRGGFRALSPEGLPFRVRGFKNAPSKDLGFWSEALKSQLVKEGYRPNGEARSFRAGALEGSIREWVVPYGEESWLYLTALVVTGKRIILAEAAGPYKLYVEYRTGLEESLSGIHPR